MPAHRASRGHRRPCHQQLSAPCPVVRGLADDAGLDRVALYMKAHEDPLAYRNYWMILSNDRDLLKAIPAKGPPPDLADDFKVPLWTDHYSNLFQILRWK